MPTQTERGKDEGEFDHVANAFGGVTQALVGLGIPERERSKGRQFAPDSARAAVESALAQPQWGPVRAAKELKNRGVDVTPGEVQQIWQHYALTDKSNRMRASQRSRQMMLEIMRTEFQEDDSDEAKLRRLWLLLGVSMCTMFAALALYLVS